MHTWYKGDRLDLQWGSNDNEEITLVFVELHLMVKLLRQTLTKEHDVWLHDRLVKRRVTATALWNYLHAKPLRTGFNKLTHFPTQWTMTPSTKWESCFTGAYKAQPHCTWLTAALWSQILPVVSDSGLLPAISWMYHDIAAVSLDIGLSPLQAKGPGILHENLCDPSLSSGFFGSALKSYVFTTHQNT